MGRQAAVIRRIESLPGDLQSLVSESAGEGFRMLQRLADEWEMGDNRF